MRCFFASDLHGSLERYGKLFAAAAAERPAAVLLGGDLLPGGLAPRLPVEGQPVDFLYGYLAPAVTRLRAALGAAAPRILLILGNDDPRCEEAAILDLAAQGLWEYVHQRRVELGRWTLCGYACTPPSPFLLKDWERYDVSRYVDPGCVSPEQGRRTIPLSVYEARHGTIQVDLERLAGDRDLAQAIFLFHAPPYQTALDRAALDGQMVDHVPLDLHVGSIAIQRFIRQRQPLLALHGHVHEAARLTGSWREQIGRTHCLGAAHDGPELALVRFDPDAPQDATRELR